MSIEEVEKWHEKGVRVRGVQYCKNPSNAHEYACGMLDENGVCGFDYYCYDKEYKIVPILRGSTKVIK